MSDSVRPHRWQPTRLPRPWDSPGKNSGVGCHFPLQCMKVKSESEVAQLFLTLIDPMDCSLPGSSIPGILQARTLEWVAISFSNAWQWKVKVKSLSCFWLLVTPWTAAYQAPLSVGFSRQEYWSGVPLPSPTRHVRLSFLLKELLPNRRSMVHIWVTFTHSLIHSPLSFPSRSSVIQQGVISCRSEETRVEFCPGTRSGVK